MVCPGSEELLTVMGDERKMPRPLSMMPADEEGMVSRVTAYPSAGSF